MKRKKSGRRIGGIGAALLSIQMYQLQTVRYGDKYADRLAMMVICVSFGFGLIQIMKSYVANAGLNMCLFLLLMQH